MEIREILSQLEFNTGVFPRQAILEAIAKKDQITPELLRILQEANQDLQKLVDKESYMAHIYALYLLAQFRERRAYPLIFDFFSIPGETVVDVTGDVVTEDLGRILASVCHGDTSLIERLIENDDANEYVRNAALEALVTLVACGVKSREEVMAYFQSLFRGKLKRKPSHVWNGLVSSSTDLYPEEVLEDIKNAFKDDLIDETFIDLPWVNERFSLGKDRLLQELSQDRHHKFMGNVVDEMGWWASFKPQERQVIETRQRVEEKPVIAKPKVLERKKVGRNEPCPCGSGKKYKHCHGSKLA